MRNISIPTFVTDGRHCPAELRAGIHEIQMEYPQRFTHGRHARQLRFVGGLQGTARSLMVVRNGAETTVHYARKADAFRALGRLLGETGRNAATHDFSEKARFELLGVIVDVSHNGVLRPETVRALIRRCVLMGINTFILYAKDTYEVPGEPFFGYLRGRYTQKELRDLDAYANRFGVEMFLAIQTLGHLGQVLQWPAYADYRDMDEILIVGEKKTYELIDRMVDARYKAISVITADRRDG